MRGSTIYHPLFATHPRVGINTSMTDRVEIYERTGGGGEWTPGGGIDAGSRNLVYVGAARVQPNVDWRARDRNHSGELTATHTTRVQIPIGKNELGATFDSEGNVIEYGPDAMVSKDYEIIVTSSEADAAPWLTEYVFVVRNAQQASQKWLFTFIADAGTRLVDGQ